MNPDTLTINGVIYTAATRPSTVRIVILQRGWVMIGRWQQDGEMVTLTDAKVIRRWGTKTGLGQLRAGPTAATILDPAGTVRCHALAVIASIDCDDTWPL